MQYVSVNVEWGRNTYIFYLFIILGCYLITLATRRYMIHIKLRIPLWSLLVWGLLFFVKGFGTTGRDLRDGYFLNFLSATSMKRFRDQSVELGYRVLNVIVRNVTSEYWVFIVVISTMTLFPIIYVLKKYQHHIDLPIAVLMYSSIFYFTGLSALRMAAAAAIGLLAFDAMIANKPVKAITFIILASLFHTASIVLFIPLILYIMKLFDRKFILISMLSCFLIVFINRNSLASLLFSSNERYRYYDSFSNIDIGMEILIYYLPFFLLAFLIRKSETDKRIAGIMFTYLILSFVFGMLGYVFSIFGRFKDVFLPLIIIIPYYIKLFKESYPQYRRLINLIALIYCVARFTIYIVQYYPLEDLMPYTNIFGWVI